MLAAAPYRVTRTAPAAGCVTLCSGQAWAGPAAGRAVSFGRDALLSRREAAFARRHGAALDAQLKSLRTQSFISTWPDVAQFVAKRVTFDMCVPMALHGQTPVYQGCPGGEVEKGTG